MIKIKRREIAPLCQCGCKQPVTWNNRNKCWYRFIKHHFRKNPKPILNYRLCACGCGKLVKTKYSYKYGTSTVYIWGHNRRGISPSKETNIKRGISIKKAYENNPIYGENISERMKKDNPMFRPEIKNKSSKSHSGKKLSEETKIKMIKTPEQKEVLSKITKKHWDSLTEEERNEKIKKSMSNAKNIHPNKPEITVLNLLNEHCPNEWKFVGDGEVIIAGKCPDFINKDNNKLIELYGDYWHRNDNPKDRIDIFKPYGYDTLVIWESELKDLDKVKFKIDKFIG